MKVSLTTTKELEDPRLEINVQLETGKIDIYLTYTCPKCAGHGCKHGSPCDDSKQLAPEEVVSTLGDSAACLIKLLNQLTYPKQ